MDTNTFLCCNSLLLTLILILTTILPSLPITIAIPDCLNRSHTLSTQSTDSTYSWTSPSGNFAFGFQFKDQGNHVPQPLLSIRFAKSPNQTIVWYAKPDRAVPVGSKANITSNGIVILDPQGNVMWRRPKNDNLIASCASMNDDGNFVICDNDTNPIWESFTEPTDSLLPCINLTKSQSVTLQARKSDAVFSNGNFNLSWQGDGNLVLYYSSKSASGSQQRAYWASGTNNRGSRLVFDEFGHIYIAADDTTTISNITNGIPGSKEFYYYVARIDPDGVFRLYNFRRNNEVVGDGGCTSGMNPLESIPDDICLVTVDQKENFQCGLNSYCVFVNQKTECRCPENYSPFSSENDPNNLTHCRPDFPPPTCFNDGSEMNQDQIDFKEYPNLNWPFSDYDFQEGAIEKEMCKEKCREDCFCAAVIYNKHDGVGQCWKKKYPLSNGRLSTKAESETIALLKFRKLGSNNKKRSYLTFILSFLLGSSVFFNILLLSAFLGVFIFLRKRKLLGQQAITSLASSTVRSYTYKELEKASGGFKQILGRGGYGTVYKGVLPSDTKRYVAIKKLNRMVQEGDDEFKMEVNVIGQTHHRNLVRLLGYCEEGEHRLLVYEYMSNGSLDGFLFGISRPHWNQRVQIALGIARGLTYLHEECSTQIIHCDIKSHNILLDELFTPRISDFGLVKLLLAEQSRVARTGLRGTIGYFAPEWFSKASITSKVDVYSFGVMLLELICCKSSVAFAVANEEQVLVDWAYDCYKLGKITKLVENDEEARNDIGRVEKHVMIAIWCVQEDPSLRPSMKKVTHMLEDVTAVSLPPRPSMFSSFSSNSSFA